MTSTDDLESLGLDGLNNMGEEDDSFEISPQESNFSTFQLRTDPSELLDQIREQITMQVKHYHKGGKYGDKNGKYDYKQKTGTISMCNALGIEQILNTIKIIINNHTVQGNTTQERHRENMRSISDTMTRIFWTKRKLWKMELKDVNSLLGSIIPFIDYFLSRTINNEERIRYGETYKENTNRSLADGQNNNNPFAKLYSFLKK